MQEIWKDIPGYEGLYQVSNLGRVKSFAVMVRYPTKKTKPRILKLITDKWGYKRVNLYLNRRMKQIGVHQLVAQTFISNPNNYAEINHKDEIVANNRVENLEWCDRVYNIQYGSRTERMAKTRGKAVAQITKDGELVATYYSIGEAGRRTGLDHRVICRVCNGKAKLYHGFRWEFL